MLSLGAARFLDIGGGDGLRDSIEGERGRFLNEGPAGRDGFDWGRADVDENLLAEAGALEGGNLEGVFDARLEVAGSLPIALAERLGPLAGVLAEGLDVDVADVAGLVWMGGVSDFEGVFLPETLEGSFSRELPRDPKTDEP